MATRDARAQREVPHHAFIGKGPALGHDTPSKQYIVRNEG